MSFKQVISPFSLILCYLLGIALLQIFQIANMHETGKSRQVEVMDCRCDEGASHCKLAGSTAEPLN